MRLLLSQPNFDRFAATSNRDRYIDHNCHFGNRGNPKAIMEYEIECLVCYMTFLSMKPLTRALFSADLNTINPTRRKTMPPRAKYSMELT